MIPFRNDTTTKNETQPIWSRSGEKLNEQDRVLKSASIDHFEGMMIMSTLYQINALSWKLYSAILPKQQLAGKRAAVLGHSILIPNQTVFALTPLNCVLIGELANANFIQFLA